MLTIYYKVFNEADFLWESLTNIYSCADRIVILEYCLESMRKVILDSRVTDRGLSTDGTTEIIKDFPDPDHKIEYRPMGFVWGGENLIYQYMIDDINVGDYMWVIDGDIVYEPKFAGQIKEWCDNNIYDVIWVCEPVFWHDFYHIKSSFTPHHQRILKKQSNASFYYPVLFEAKWVWDPMWRIAYYERHAHLYLGDLENFRWKNPYSELYEDKQYNPKWCEQEKGEFAYHYAYVRPLQKVIEKLLWQYEMIDRKWNNVGAREHCSMFQNPLDFKLQTMDWFTAGQPDDYGKWELGQPDIMKNNKWSDYRWDEKPLIIDFEEAQKLVKWGGIC